MRPSDAELGSEYFYDEREAGRAEAFFEKYLVHIDGEWAGRPFTLEEWQRGLVTRLFGTKRKADGLRRYRRFGVEIPRKQGKSTLGAGLALRMLAADNEPGAQVYIAAENRRQAGVIYRLAAEMVHRNAELNESCDVLQSTKRILFPRTASFLEVLPGDAPTARGINAHGAIVDELLTQKNRQLFDVLNTSQAARRQPILGWFSTAGMDPDSVWGQEHDYAAKVRDGVIEDPTYLAVLYGADIKDDWKDPAIWKKANPSWDSLGATFQKAIAEAAKKAEDAPAFLNSFLREHLNIPTRQDIRWLPMGAWDATAGIVNRDALKGRICYAGLDIANTEDLAAWALVFPPADGDPNDDGEYQILWRYWIPADTVPKRVRLARVPYDTWIADGRIKTTDGEVTSYSQIEKDIAQDAQDFQIAQVRYDPWNAAQLVQHLQDEGLECVPIQQGFRMLSAPSKELLRLVVGQRLRHGGNPVSRWMADNVVVRQDPYGNVRPAKDRSREKIDGIVAAILAIDGAMRNRTDAFQGSGEIQVIG